MKKETRHKSEENSTIRGHVHVSCDLARMRLINSPKQKQDQTEHDLNLEKIYTVQVYPLKPEQDINSEEDSTI